MKYIIETSQIVNTCYSVEAENEEDAILAYHSGWAEEVDQWMMEELLEDVYADDTDE